MISADSKIFEKLIALAEERSFNWKVEEVFEGLGFSISQHDASNYIFKNHDVSIKGELYYSSHSRLVRCIIHPTKEMYNTFKQLSKSLPGYSFMMGIADSPGKFTRITFQNIPFTPRRVSFHISDMNAF
jgi:hypothetical protein